MPPKCSLGLQVSSRMELVCMSTVLRSLCESCVCRGWSRSWDEFDTGASKCYISYITQAELTALIASPHCTSQTYSILHRCFADVHYNTYQNNITLNIIIYDLISTWFTFCEFLFIPFTRLLNQLRCLIR